MKMKTPKSRDRNTKGPAFKLTDPANAILVEFFQLHTTVIAEMPGERLRDMYERLVEVQDKNSNHAHDKILLYFISMFDELAANKGS